MKEHRLFGKRGHHSHADLRREIPHEADFERRKSGAGFGSGGKRSPSIGIASGRDAEWLRLRSAVSSRLSALSPVHALAPEEREVFGVSGRDFSFSLPIHAETRHRLASRRQSVPLGEGDGSSAFLHGVDAARRARHGACVSDHPVSVSLGTGGIR